MKLQLSVFAQDLPNVANHDKVYAVVVETRTNKLLGETEHLQPSSLLMEDVLDWTQLFWIGNFQLGTPLEVEITLYKENENNTHLLGSAVFDINTILGKGGTYGKQLPSQGGIVFANVERSCGMGFLHLELQATDLKSSQAQVDPYFEIQKKRRLYNANTADNAQGKPKIVWDTVFRSRPMEDTTSPTWDPVCIDLATVLTMNNNPNQNPNKQTNKNNKTKNNNKNKHQPSPMLTVTPKMKKEPFRIAIHDYDATNEQDSLIGFVRVSVHELLQAASSSSSGNPLSLHNKGGGGGKQKPVMGKLFVRSARIEVDPTNNNNDDNNNNNNEDTPKKTVPNEEKDNEPEILVSSRGGNDEEDDDDEEIIVEAMMMNNNPMEITSEELFVGGVEFTDYISGGCQLRVVIAIDFTASNGDPRKEHSLHQIRNDGRWNMYQTAIYKICTILSPYDSDQKYPVWGFGAKQQGNLSQCFNIVSSSSSSTITGNNNNNNNNANKPTNNNNMGAEANGVDGILQAYQNAFQSGLVMSGPTNVTQVIKAAGKDAKTKLDVAMTKSGNQEYSILIIFTNGNVHNVQETINAIEAVQNDPLSIIVIGVGPSSFQDMGFWNERRDQFGNRVQFVNMKAHTKRTTMMASLSINNNDHDNDNNDDDDDDLTKVTLQGIPQQLVSYFQSKNIPPNPPIELEEIIIEPFPKTTTTTIAVSSTTTTTTTTTSDNNNNTNQANATAVGNTNTVQQEHQQQEQQQQQEEEPSRVRQSLTKVSQMGTNMMKKQGQRQFGRIRMTLQRSFDSMVDKKVFAMLGIPPPKPQKKKQKRPNKKMNMNQQMQHQMNQHFNFHKPPPGCKW